jgi:2-amino-4-hydroxy-6-hydroxymethyldihydropteridine diphosphokinase
MTDSVMPAQASGSPLWTPAYIGLGSNLEDPPAQLRRAVGSLAALPLTRVIAVSAFYRNPPLGVAEQPWYVNAAVALLTQLAPRDLLAHLKQIETAQGRVRSDDRWGPRIIDLDLLIYGDLRVQEPDLTLPHAGIAERNFVLFPLLDIAPGLQIPGEGRVGQLAARLNRNNLEPVA